MKAKNKKLAPIVAALNLIKEFGFSKRMGKAGAFSYMLAVADNDFMIRKSIREISDESGIDYVTVQTTFNILYEKEVIKPKAYCVYEIDYGKLMSYMESKQFKKKEIDYVGKKI